MVDDLTSEPEDPILDASSLAALADSVKPAVLSEERRLSMRARLLERVRAEPQPPPNSVTRRASDMPWHKVAPNIEVKVLRYDRKQQNQTLLVKLHPGAVFPGHAHTQEEECLVIEGTARVGNFVIYEGDMHIAKPGCVHPDITTDTGALLMIRSELTEINFPA